MCPTWVQEGQLTAASTMVRFTRWIKPYMGVPHPQARESPLFLELRQAVSKAMVGFIACGNSFLENRPPLERLGVHHRRRGNWVTLVAILFMGGLKPRAYISLQTGLSITFELLDSDHKS